MKSPTRLAPAARHPFSSCESTRKQANTARLLGGRCLATALHVRPRRQTRAHLAALWPLALSLACSDVELASDSSFAPSGGFAPGDFDSAQPGEPARAGSNVSFGGSQDFGFFRGQLEAGLVPSPEALDAPGFFAEHHTELPPPTCGERVCLQPMLAVMGNLIDGSNCTLLQLGLSSPVLASPEKRPPLSLSVVVDTSGSMSGEKIAFVRQGLTSMLDGLNDNDRFALVSYASTAQALVDLTPVRGNRVALQDAVDALFAGGDTNLHAGLSAGYRQLMAGYDPSRQNRVILLSDGIPTSGTTSTPEILEMSRAFNSDGIGLTTIGLGRDFNAELMRGLAQQADGNFYFLESASAVEEVFEEELSFFSVPIAFDLELEVTTGAGYDFGRALGAPAWRDQLSGGRLSIPSVFLAHRESDEDVTAAGGRRGGGSALMLELMPRQDEPARAAGGAESDGASTVAQLSLQFRDPTTNRTVQEQLEVTAPFSPTTTPERGHFDAPDPAAIQKSFVMLNIYVGFEQATLAFHRGNAGPQTLGDLSALIAAVEDYNEEVGDVDIASDLQLLYQLSDNMVASGVGRPERRFPRDPWPAD